MISIYSNELLPIAILTHKMYNRYNMCMDNISAFANPTPVRRYKAICMIELKRYFIERPRKHSLRQYKYKTISEFYPKLIGCDYIHYEKKRNMDAVKRNIIANRTPLLQYFLKNHYYPSNGNKSAKELLEMPVDEYAKWLIENRIEIVFKFNKFFDEFSKNTNPPKIEGIKYYKTKLGFKAKENKYEYFNFEWSFYDWKYSPEYLKRWDKTTKKTSNSGEKAQHYGSSWRFDNCIQAPQLERLCKINGFKKEKGKTYYYGDYAEWWLKL